MPYHATPTLYETIATNLPIELVALIFSHLNLMEMSAARLTCRLWRHLGLRDDVLAAAAANTSAHACRITRKNLKSLLKLTDTDLRLLPSQPFVTRRGYTCWLYGPRAVYIGLRLRRERADTQLYSVYFDGSRGVMI